MGSGAQLVLLTALQAQVELLHKHMVTSETEHASSSWGGANPRTWKLVLAKSAQKKSGSLVKGTVV